MAICYGKYWISWTCWDAYAIVTICSGTGVRFCISTCYKHHQKLLLHMNKVIEMSALNSWNSFVATCFNFVSSDQEVDNYKTPIWAFGLIDLLVLLEEWILCNDYFSFTFN